jgi:amino acid adenylation domain-containing protein
MQMQNGSHVVDNNRVGHMKVPLHPAQQDVYFDQILNPGSSHYNIGGYLIVKGNIVNDCLIEAIGSFSEVFDVFNTRFHFDDDILMCEFLSDRRSIELSEMDFSQKGNPRREAMDWMLARFNLPFDISKGKFYEICFIKISDRESFWFMKCHHMLADGYGYAIMIDYLARKYSSLVRNVPLEGMPYFPYSKEVLESSQYLVSEAYLKDAAYWKNQLGDLPASLLRRRNSAMTSGSERISVEISSALRESFKNVCDETKTSLQQLTIAALTIYFGKVAKARDFVLGVATHNRRSKQQRRSLGMFSTVIPFKARYEENRTLLDVIEDIRLRQRSDYRYQSFPVSHLGRELRTVNSKESSFLEIIVNYEAFDLEVRFEGLRVESKHLSGNDSHFPLELRWCDYGKGQPLELKVDFQKSYFDRVEAEQLTALVLYILEHFKGSLREQIGSISIMPPGEREMLLKEFNDTEVEYPRDKTIADLFEEQVKRTPEATAVVYEGSSLSYRELDERSSQVAHYLKGLGVREESLVCMCVDRSLEMIVGILGIMKAGGAYVPIDPTYPQERIEYILEDTACGVVLTSEAHRGLINGEGVGVVSLDGEWGVIAKESKKRPSTKLEPANLAYVIYTSGSTGKPKGVMNQHSGLVNRLLWAQGYYHFTGEDVILQKTTYCFDVSVWELLWPLLAGSKIVFARPEGHKDSFYLKELIREEGVTTVHFVPSMLQAFLLDIDQGDCKSLLRVLCSGEALKAEQVNLFGEKLAHVELYNLYGPTEAAIDVTYWKAEGVRYTGSIPIGVPVANTQLYIVDKRGNLSGIGIGGELCIGGVQVSRGYLNREELTAEKFIDNPFSEEAGSRLYRTGDLCRWLSDGKIEYLGRIDDQVKIRGYRIELGEIETVLSQSGLVKQCVVLAREDGAGMKRLVAYVVPSGVYNKEGMQSYLGSQLPEYMVPGLYVEMASLPLTSNGKVDRKSLPAADASLLQGEDYVAPRNETEEKLAGIWKEVLRVDRVGVYDNFFQLGGDSIKTIHIISRAKRDGISLMPIDLFQYQNIASLSEYLYKGSRGKESSAPTYNTDILIPFRKDGARRPMFFVPGAGGNVLPFYNLSIALPDDQPFYSFQAQGSTGEFSPLKTVEEMASLYVAEMQMVDPTGPYIIGGYSFGGQVAFEMALQLERKGFEVSQLIILDSERPNRDLDRTTRPEITYELLFPAIIFNLQEFYPMKVDFSISEIENKPKEEQLDILIEKLKGAGYEFSKMQLRGFINVFSKNLTISYTPEPAASIAAPILIFKTMPDQESSAVVEKIEDHTGWNKFTSHGITSYRIGGSHTSFLKVPIVKNLAEVLKRYLLKS